MRNVGYKILKSDICEKLAKICTYTGIIESNRESVTIDFSIWMLESMDKESVRLGVNRQSLIKHWLVEKLPQNIAA